jgi:hypothetical protein
MASGVLMPKYAHHPVTRLRKEPMDKRRLSEMAQIIRQLISPLKEPAEACLSFAQPVTLSQLQDESNGSRIFPALIARAHSLLQEHRLAWNTPY